MKRWNQNGLRALFRVALTAAACALMYTGASLAQTGDAGRYVTMSERIGIFIVLFRAFDVWIYFFQAILLFLGIGFTTYYLIRFHQQGFLTKLHKTIDRLTAGSDLDPRHHYCKLRLAAQARQRNGHGERANRGR